MGAPRTTFRNAVLAAVRGSGRVGGQLSRVLRGARGHVAVGAPSVLSRRLVLKARVVPMRAGGAKAAALHLRYIQRDGVERDGSKGVLYGPGGDADAEAFEQPIAGEKHQFRFILSPEDGDELEMTSFVRRFMAQVEKDTDQRLDWAAVNHFNTGNPHAHILVRGVDRDGQGVRFDRQYISNGMRARAQELVTLELGPRTALDIQRARAREITQDRVTSLDRDLAKRAVDGIITLRGDDGRRPPALLTARLQHLPAIVFGVDLRALQAAHRIDNHAPARPRHASLRDCRYSNGVAALTCPRRSAVCSRTRVARAGHWRFAHNVSSS
jgi:hypothetical protein